MFQVYDGEQVNLQNGKRVWQLLKVVTQRVPRNGIRNNFVGTRCGLPYIIDGLMTCFERRGKTSKKNKYLRRGGSK